MKLNEGGGGGRVVRRFEEYALEIYVT